MEKRIVELKQNLVDEVKAIIKDAPSTFVVEYRGLDVKKLAELRTELRKDGNEMKVYKNSIVVRAVNSLGHKSFEKELVGPNALVFSKSDAVSGAKVLTKFAKKNKKLILKGAIVEGKVVDVNEVMILSSLPDKQGMISMLLGCLQAPIRNLACTLKAVADK